MTINVSIDAPGGDRGIPVAVAAGLRALGAYDDLHLVFVGDKTRIETEINHHSAAEKMRQKFSIVHADEVIAMDEPVASALRKKKNSSMRVAVDLVKSKTVDACVSAGNTGALVAISRFVLRTIYGIERPAIMVKMPTIKGYTHVLDLGANIDSRPEILLEFAIVGSITVAHTENIENPSVGLLNIGEEEVKGNEHIKQTAELLKQSTLNYVGFVEGDDIYKGAVDIVVCDGFIGNIVLKASEGVALMMRTFLREAFAKNLFTKIVALINRPIFKDFKSKLDPKNYNGASLLGLNGIVIKSHGNANVDSFFQAINEARLQARARINEKIAEQVKDALKNHKK